MLIFCTFHADITGALCEEANRRTTPGRILTQVAKGLCQNSYRKSSTGAEINRAKTKNLLHEQKVLQFHYLAFTLPDHFLNPP